MKKLFYGLCLIIPGFAYAQTDTLGIMPVIDAQKKSIEQSSNILNGRNHIAYSSLIQGSGYLLTDWRTGTVVYEDILYTGVQLKYDDFKDELILLHPNGLPIILFTPRVKQFSLDKRQFINFQISSTPLAGSEPGFYEILTRGNIQLLAKRKKAMNEVLQTTGSSKTFVGRTEYIAVKDGILHKIKKESNLFDLVPAKKQGAKNILREKGIMFKNDPELTLQTIAQYYNQSSN